MRTKPSLSRIYFTIAAALAVTLTGTVGTAIASTTRTAPSAPDGSRAFHLVATATDVKFLGEHRLPGGNYVATWRMFGNDSVTVAGPSGSTVFITPPVRAAHAGAFGIQVRPPVIKAKGQALIRLAEQYARSGNSPMQDALAVGFTKEQAARIAARAARNIARATASIPPGTIILDFCVSGKGDGGYAWAKSCEVQKMVQDNGGGNWYLGDEVTGSAEDTYPSDSMWDFQDYLAYPSGNTIIKWNPAGTSSVGCGTKSISLGAFGFSFGVSFQTCTGTYGPYGLPSLTTFGSEWKGCDWQPVVEGTGSLDVVHSPANANDSPILHVTVAWHIC